MERGRGARRYPTAMRIPITMCHGVEREARGRPPLTAAHFDTLMGIAHDLGFRSVNYDDLAAWRAGQRDLPPRPIMLDFDHPVKSMCQEVLDILQRVSDQLYQPDLALRRKPNVVFFDLPPRHTGLGQ